VETWLDARFGDGQGTGVEFDVLDALQKLRSTGLLRPAGTDAGTDRDGLVGGGGVDRGALDDPTTAFRAVPLEEALGRISDVVDRTVRVGGGILPPSAAKAGADE
jgi:hypothetical protein